MKIPYERRKSLYGYGFIAIWIVGTIKWFLIPLITSLIYSFQNVTPETGGPVSTWAGISNYKYAFMSDPNYRELLVQVLKETFQTAPLIIIFSLFIAVIGEEPLQEPCSSCRSSLPPARCTISSTAT